MHNFCLASGFLRLLALAAMLAIGTAAAAFEPAPPGGPTLEIEGNASPDALANALASGTLKTYAANSLVIPMDTDFQDSGAFFAYGLVYKLLANGIPVDWVIDADKRVSTIAPSPNGATASGNTAAYTTTNPHNLIVGDVVAIAGVGVAGYNGARTVASVISATQFTATIALSGLAPSGGGTVTPQDLVASFSDFQSPAITGTHAYRGGPFVIDQANRATANPIVQAWSTSHPQVKVHIATSSFTGNVARSLVAAPRIGVFDDGNTTIAFAYLNAAGIPDSQGNAWTLPSVDVVSPLQVAGVSTTNHREGALFDANGVPVFSLLVSAHYSSTGANIEAIAEAGEFLKSRTLLIAQCQAVLTFENNGRFITDLGMTTGTQPASVDHYFGDEPLAQDDGTFGTIGGSVPSYVPTSVYSGAEGVDFFRIIRGLSAPNPDVVILGNAFRNAAGGRVMYLGGHQYSTTLPLSTNPTSHGVRYFLNALLFAPSTATGDGIGDLSLTLNGPASSANAALDYTITYRNSGAGVSLATQVSVAIPSGMTASMISGGGVLSAGQIVWNLGNVNAGQPASPGGTLSFRLNASGYGNFTISANGNYKRGITPASVASSINTSYAAATVPGAPVIGAATPRNGQASIAFTPPGSDGGSAITGYSATCNPGGHAASGVASPIVVPGLANGTAYSCSVTAANAIGTGSASGVVTVTPRGELVDFNADGKPDMIWSNTANGATYVWYMNGPVLISDAFIASIDPSWKIQGVADFNGDGKPDLVWRNTANGSTYVWYMNGPNFLSDAFVFSLPPEWVIQGVADFNGDGKPDFLMRNTNTGVAFVWFFNDNVAIGDQFLFGIDPSWKVEQVGDLNADGQPDLLFRNTGSGLAFAWNTQWSAGSLSLAGSSAPIFSIDPVWEVVQLADWNGDGKPDLLFRNRNTGVVFVWYMTGTTLGGSDFIIQIDPSWEIVPRR